MVSGDIGRKFMHVNLAAIVDRLRNRGLLRTHRDKLLYSIPATTLPQIVDKPMICVNGSYTYSDGTLPWCDLIALLSILVDTSPSTVFEIGTFNGSTTLFMALNLPNAAIHTIDLPQNFDDRNTGLRKDDWHLIATRRIGSEYLADPSIKSITQHFGDTAEYTFPAAEFFFIDGSHTYPYIRNDTEKALSSGKAKMLVWHDCDRNHAEVLRWLAEMVESGHPVRRIEGTHLAMLDLRNSDSPHRIPK
jgi:hypothetical protein